MADPLFTMPITDPELRDLKIAAARAKLSMAEIVRRGVIHELSKLNPEGAETWEAMQVKRAEKRAARL